MISDDQLIVHIEYKFGIDIDIFTFAVSSYLFIIRYHDRFCAAITRQSGGKCLSALHGELDISSVQQFSISRNWNCKNRVEVKAIVS
jgi:hypothetical protein